MLQEAMKSAEGGAGGSGAGDIVHNDPDLAAFLKHLVTGEEAADNDDKGMNVWGALDGDDLPSHDHDGVLGGVLGRTGGSKDDKAVSSGHDIFLDEETEKVLARGGLGPLWGWGRIYTRRRARRLHRRASKKCKRKPSFDNFVEPSRTFQEVNIFFRHIPPLSPHHPPPRSLSLFPSVSRLV